MIEYWFTVGARNVYLFENSTQANYTRIVFRANGYARVCKETGAKPIYLDEDNTEIFAFHGKKSVDDGDPEGYDRTTFHMPTLVAEKLIRRRSENLYVSLPKLKTHSMGVVTLGIKNQWGLPAHGCRRFDHNFNLHHKLVDLLEYVRPDVTLIEGVEGTIHGHYPPTSLADECVKPLRVLVGSRNVVAADVVGARIFGFDVGGCPPHPAGPASVATGAGSEGPRTSSCPGTFEPWSASTSSATPGRRKVPFRSDRPLSLPTSASCEEPSVPAGRAA